MSVFENYLNTKSGHKSPASWLKFTYSDLMGPFNYPEFQSYGHKKYIGCLEIEIAFKSAANITENTVTW